MLGNLRSLVSGSNSGEAKSGLNTPTSNGLPNAAPLVTLNAIPPDVFFMEIGPFLDTESDVNCTLVQKSNCDLKVSDKDEMLAAVQRNGMALHFASAALKGDPEAVSYTHLTLPTNREV